MFNKFTRTTLAQTIVSTRSKSLQQFAKPVITFKHRLSLTIS